MLKSLSLLGFVGGFVAAEVAFAQISEISIPIVRQTAETYEQMLQRAENSAKTTIAQRFKQDKSLTTLKVMVIGENDGMVAPLLSVQVTRQQWEKNPTVQPWKTIFLFSKTLLGFESIPNRPPQNLPTNTNPTTTASDQKPPEPQNKPSPTIIPDDLPLGDPYAQDQPQQPLPNQRLRTPSTNSPTN